jgi:hypothetical protein
MHRFGWVRSAPDPRDFHYRCPTQVLQALPPSIDLSQPALGSPFEPAWDQGELGSCGPNTLGENIVWDDLKAGQTTVMPSRLFLYYVTRSLMGTVTQDSGVDNRTMLKAFAQYGFCDESLWPYDTGKFTEKPPQACFDQAAQRKPNIVYQAVAQQLDQMKGCLVATGKPFIFGFVAFQSLMSPAVAASGDVPDPNILDRQIGGHDVLICGYDDASQRFKFKNHWGQWGRNGYGTISYAYALTAQLAGDFWTVTQAPEGITPPKPAPGNLQQQIDAIFAAIEAQITNPTLLLFVQTVQEIVDAYLSSRQSRPMALTVSELQTIVDAIFAQLIAAESKPFLKLALRLVQGLVDRYLSSHGL